MIVSFNGAHCKAVSVHFAPDMHSFHLLLAAVAATGESIGESTGRSGDAEYEPAGMRSTNLRGCAVRTRYRLGLGFPQGLAVLV
jgi:hypothetical protein